MRPSPCLVICRRRAWTPVPKESCGLPRTIARTWRDRPARSRNSTSRRRRSWPPGCRRHPQCRWRGRPRVGHRGSLGGLRRRRADGLEDVCRLWRAQQRTRLAVHRGELQPRIPSADLRLDRKRRRHGRTRIWDAAVYGQRLPIPWHTRSLVLGISQGRAWNHVGNGRPRRGRPRRIPLRHRRASGQPRRGCRTSGRSGTPMLAWSRRDLPRPAAPQRQTHSGIAHKDSSNRHG